MNGSYYDETAGLALVALIGVCVLSGARCARLAYGCPVIAETRIVGRKPCFVALWVALDTLRCVG